MRKGNIVDITKGRKARSPAQRAATRRFLAAWQPICRQDGVGETWVEEALRGAMLYHPVARWTCRYMTTYVNNVDGETYLLVEVIAQGRGTAMRLPAVWSCARSKLRRVVG